MREDILLGGPVAFLAEELRLAPPERLLAFQAWWETEGFPLSLAIDRLGTPHLRQFSPHGERIDEVGYPPSYAYLLHAGYSAGIISEVAQRHDLRLSYMLGFITSYYDPGLYCPYTVTLSTWVPLYKYYWGERREEFLSLLGRSEAPFGQGATWMTEIGGGSDLGAHVHTQARKAEGELWHLSGDKYFASNVGADLAVVAARPEGAPPGVKGVALFVVPRLRLQGGLNYYVRRLKDKIGTRSVPTGEVELRHTEAYLIGEARQGIYYVLEVLNFSRVSNAVGVVAHGLHALAQAYRFAQRRRLFGKFLVEQPLFRQELAYHYERLRWAGALAWLSEQWLETVWLEKPPYSERYALFRLLTHLAKFWTAKVALAAAHWCVEVWGGLGILAEFPVERFVRELMVTDIWEGTRHRHLLDGWEVLRRFGLLGQLTSLWDLAAVDASLVPELEAALARPEEEALPYLEPLLTRLAQAIGQLTAAQSSYTVLI
ncbi:MAG: acyl-CoA dehydrogenase [Bacteroidetes bacterium]|nr:MAG: acyl-CoA dehydrogenase [Bacteroidota bacterium]